jgi:hypothetical protein
MSDVYSSIIVNKQHNSNTTLQASSLQSTKGPLNTMFNLQGLRTVTGRVDIFPNFDNFFSEKSNILLPVINTYDGSPVKLNQADIILSLTVSSGNKPDTNNNIMFTGGIYLPTGWPRQTSNGVTFCLGKEPSNSGVLNYQEWAPKPTNFTEQFPISNIFSTVGLIGVGDQNYPPSPQNIRLLYNNTIGAINNNNTTCYSGEYQWLNCYLNKGNYFPESLNLTLLILNTLISQ